VDLFSCIISHLKQLIIYVHETQAMCLTELDVYKVE